MPKPSFYDYEDLAKVLCGIDPYNEVTEVDVSEILWNRFEIGFEEFCGVAEALLHHTPVVSSILTDAKYKAFIKDGIMIVKTRVE